MRIKRELFNYALEKEYITKEKYEELISLAELNKRKTESQKNKSYLIQGVLIDNPFDPKLNPKDFYFVKSKEDKSHLVKGVLEGDNPLDINDWKFIDTQNDNQVTPRDFSIENDKL